MKTEQLIILYDGQCPLCVKEMRHLLKADSKQQIHLVDINSPELHKHFPDVSYHAAMNKLHGYLEDHNGSKLITGLDVTYHAWRLVGKGWIIAPLRWPLIKNLADYCYLKFARHRFTISRWLTGQSRCESCRIDR